MASPLTTVLGELLAKRWESQFGSPKTIPPGMVFIGWLERQGPSYHRPWDGCWLRDSTMAMRMAIRLDISISPMAMGNVTRM